MLYKNSSHFYLTNDLSEPLFFTAASLWTQFILQLLCSELAPFPSAVISTKLAPSELLVTAGFSVVLSIVVFSELTQIKGISA